MHSRESEQPVGTVAELFAGVGGFRLGLEAVGWQTVYSNQWEPSTKRQHASEVYVHNFGPEGHSNEDISKVDRIPSNFDLLVGGFPCQDYSVAKSRSSATGLEGKKGVLWWEILRLTKQHQPKFLFLENVDRLLKSPASQRGRDFAIMLSSLAALGYSVEWRVVNAADYGFAQRRKRVFILAELKGSLCLDDFAEGKGVLGTTFMSTAAQELKTGALDDDLVKVSEHFGRTDKQTVFQTAGALVGKDFLSWKADAEFAGQGLTLGDILLPLNKIPDSFILDKETLAKWQYLKGAKSEERTHSSGYRWRYSEGSMSFPDPVDRPSRTILTGEGGSTPSRFKHVVDQDGHLRRLHPIELERLNGFPDDWTREGTQGVIQDGKRAFFMGNALVVGLIRMVGATLAERLD